MSTITSRTSSASTIALIIGSELAVFPRCPAMATCPLRPARHAAPVLHSYPGGPLPARPPVIWAGLVHELLLSAWPGLAGGSRPASACQPAAHGEKLTS